MELTVKWEAKGIDAKIQTYKYITPCSFYLHKNSAQKKDILLPTCKKAKMAASQNSLVLLAILQSWSSRLCAENKAKP